MLYGSQWWKASNTDIQRRHALDEWCLQRIVDIWQHNFTRDANVHQIKSNQIIRLHIFHFPQFSSANVCSLFGMWLLCMGLGRQMWTKQYLSRHHRIVGQPWMAALHLHKTYDRWSDFFWYEARDAAQADIQSVGLAQHHTVIAVCILYYTGW